VAAAVARLIDPVVRPVLAKKCSLVLYILIFTVRIVKNAMAVTDRSWPRMRCNGRWLWQRLSSRGLLGVHADPERVTASLAQSLASTHGGADTRRCTQRASVRSVFLGCTRLAKASQEHQPGRRPDPRETPVGTTTVAPAATSTSSVPTTMTPPSSRKWNVAEGPG